MHTLRGSFFEPHYFQLVSNSLPYCTHIKLIVKVKKGEIVSLKEVYTILMFWSLIINLIKLIFPLSIFQVLLVLIYPSSSASLNIKRMQESSLIWHVTIHHHDRDIRHHGRDKEITIASLSIVSQDCEMCQLWAAHDLISRSWLSLLSSWLQLIILCKQSGVLTIWCHDCEQASWARD